MRRRVALFCGRFRRNLRLSCSLLRFLQAELCFIVRYGSISLCPDSSPLLAGKNFVLLLIDLYSAVREVSDDRIHAPLLHAPDVFLCVDCPDIHADPVLRAVLHLFFRERELLSVHRAVKIRMIILSR